MITVDDSSWPLVTVNFTGSNSLKELEPYLEAMDACLQRGERYLALFDTLKLTAAPSMEVRQRQIEWLRKNDALMRQRCLGNAFVITSPFVRLGLSIMYQLQPPSVPYTIVGELKSAWAWAATRFRAVGLSPPASGAGKQGLTGDGAAWPG